MGMAGGAWEVEQSVAGSEWGEPSYSAPLMKWGLMKSKTGSEGEELRTGWLAWRERWREGEVPQETLSWANVFRHPPCSSSFYLAIPIKTELSLLSFLSTLRCDLFP